MEFATTLEEDSVWTVTDAPTPEQLVDNMETAKISEDELTKEKLKDITNNENLDQISTILTELIKTEAHLIMLSNWLYNKYVGDKQSRVRYFSIIKSLSNFEICYDQKTFTFRTMFTMKCLQCIDRITYLDFNRLPQQQMLFLGELYETGLLNDDKIDSILDEWIQTRSEISIINATILLRSIGSDFEKRRCTKLDHYIQQLSDLLSCDECSELAKNSIKKALDSRKIGWKTLPSSQNKKSKENKSVDKKLVDKKSVDKKSAEKKYVSIFANTQTVSNQQGEKLDAQLLKNVILAAGPGSVSQNERFREFNTKCLKSQFETPTRTASTSMLDKSKLVEDQIGSDVEEQPDSKGSKSKKKCQTANATPISQKFGWNKKKEKGQDSSSSNWRD